MSITGLPGNIPHQGLKERNPPELHISKVRGPTSTDSGPNFDIGDIWIDLLGDDAYILVSKEQGVAVWILMSAVSGTLSFLTGDVGGPVGPDGGANINILGGTGITVTGAPGINTLTIDHTGIVASSFPVDNGGPGVPAGGAMSLLGTTSTDFPNSSGIETHVGATTNEIYYENRRFLSALVVDPSAVVGLRGEFTTITAALAAAVSGQTIYVRPGTYVENITLVAGVNLIGATTSGSAQSVVIDGSVTADFTGLVEIENIGIGPAAGDAIISTAGAPELTLVECAVAPSAGSVCSSANASLNLVMVLCNISTPAGTDLFSVTGGSYAILNTFTSNAATDRILIGGTAAMNVLGGRIEHQIETAGTGDFFVTDALVLTGTTESFNVGAGSSIRFTHITVSCNAVSTNFVIGSGTLNYADVVNLGSAENIAGTVTQAVNDWKPYGTAAASEPAVTKGTAGYDSNDFTVTNGFVQLNIPTVSGTTTTVGAVTGDVITFPLGLTPGTYTFEVDVAAFESTTPLGAGYNMSASLRTDGATATLIGVPDKNVFEEGALVAGNADIVAGGNNMIVRVTGTAGLTVDWSAVAVRVFAP